jgi:hypothetical protein
VHVGSASLLRILSPPTRLNRQYFSGAQSRPAYRRLRMAGPFYHLEQSKRGAQRLRQRALVADHAENLVKIGARIVRHGSYVVFQLAEVAVPCALFADILRRIDGLRLRSPPLPA